MGPSNNDMAGSGDLDDDPTSLGPEDVEDVDGQAFDSAGADDSHAGTAHDDDGDRYRDGDYDDEDYDDDGLAPEAGRGRPSVLSLLLLVAGAVWIVVALLKLGGPVNEGAPSMAIGDHAQTSAELPDVEDELFIPGDEAAARDPKDPSERPNPAENGDVSDHVEDNPEHILPPEVGTPASERGPPEGSLLAGKSWPQDYVAPDVVTYTIKRGGSMKVVANLYKIFHHEIEALNPGVSLDREQPPLTKIVVYRRKPGISSQSVGFPGSGSVEGGMPMVDGPGRILRHTPWKAWATQTTVATIDLVLREWARRFPNEQEIIVGNLSARAGGRLNPHSSHQSGRDVDLSYPQIWDHKSELAPQVMDERNLNRELTWSLLELLRETGAIEVIFMDSKLQKLLHEFAISTHRYSEKQLENWMEYPSTPGNGSPLIQHVRGHADHLHVRFKCTPTESRCESRDH
ncbi:penicillin-insensitive murein endopeptidase [Enhygromyxa salina]|nr:penicillin-insensitive murein endopeptidase [Enhygromyxa salina]